MGETDLSHLSDAERHALNVVAQWLMERAVEALAAKD